METNKLIVPCEFEEIIINDGSIRLKLNGKWGFVDYTGREVIPCIYDKAEIFDVERYFIEGFARVSKNDKWGLVDKNGKEIVPCVYDTLFNSDGERAFFSRKTENDYIYGYVYMNGREDIC